MIGTKALTSRTSDDRVSFLGYSVYANSCESSVSGVLEEISQAETPIHVACLNPHSVAIARNDEGFSRALRSAFLLLPDGIGVVLGARALSSPVHERIAGMNFFVELCRQANANECTTFYFLGSTDEVLKRIAERLRLEFPNIRLVGMQSPPFRKRFSRHESLAMIRDINVAAPDILWVGMTAPKQEKWIHDALPNLKVGAAIAVGAVFDFYAGTKTRGPDWMRRIGLEWLARMIQEPARLWKRNFISTPVFLYLLVREKLGRRS